MIPPASKFKAKFKDAPKGVTKEVNYFLRVATSDDQLPQN